MSGHLVIAWMLGTLALASAGADDLLRFTNGDQLHGTFGGVREGQQLTWRRDDATPVDFKFSQLRHIVLNGGRPVRSLSSLSYAGLVNGDRIPGTIREMDADAVTLETLYAGVLKIPRSQISMLAPSPLGGRVHYHGPFIEDEWKMANASFPQGMPPVADAKRKPDQELPGCWAFSGSAWYWPSKHSGTALLREDGMPDRSILRFDLAWKNRLAIAIGFHADLVKTKPMEQPQAGAEIQKRQPGKFAPGDSSIFPLLFGNSYVLQVFSTHIILYRTAVNQDGGPSVERIQINGNSIRLGDTGKATVEIRSNRQTGDISLFVNDEFAVQWNEGGGDPARYAGKGKGFGFVVQTEDSPVKISDVMVAEWNGMPDSARSLQVDDQDIVLLANGTDRFSGKVESLRDGKLGLEGKYGRFQIGLDDIAEIRFARSRLARDAESQAQDLTVKFSPFGRISGRPLSGAADSLRLHHSVLGDLTLKLESAVMLDFQPSTNLIDDWDAEF